MVALAKESWLVKGRLRVSKTNAATFSKHLAEMSCGQSNFSLDREMVGSYSVSLRVVTRMMSTAVSRWNRCKVRYIETKSGASVLTFQG